MLLFSSADFFHFFSEKSIPVKLSVSYSVDPDQDRCSVCSDLGPSCFAKVIF